MCEPSVKCSATATRRSFQILPEQRVDHLLPVLTKLYALEQIAHSHTKLLNDILRSLQPYPDHPGNVPKAAPDSSTRSQNSCVAVLMALNDRIGTVHGGIHDGNPTSRSIQKGSPRVTARSKDAVCGSSRGKRGFEGPFSSQHPGVARHNQNGVLPDKKVAQAVCSEQDGSATATSTVVSSSSSNKKPSYQKAHHPGVSTPPSCRWLSVVQMRRVARNRASRELEATPGISHGYPMRPMLSQHGSPLMKAKQYINHCVPSAGSLSSSTNRVLAAGADANEKKWKSCFDKDEMCLICLFHKSDSMHLAKPTLFRIECGHEFHLHCLAEVVQRRECRKECAVCLVPISHEQSAAILAESKKARKNPEVKLYQQQLSDAIARLSGKPAAQLA